MGSSLAAFFQSAEKYIGDSIKPKDEKQKNRRIAYFFLFIFLFGLLAYFCYMWKEKKAS